MEQRNSSIPLTDFLFNKASLMNIPLSGTFELTPLCNFSCKMCYVRKTKEEVVCSQRQMMNYEQWIQIAKDAKEAGMLYILLTGGEPLLWPDFWKLYVELVKMGFLVSINTNGSMIDDQAINILKKYPPRRINITLYGACNETYEKLCGIKNIYSKVVESIIKLKNEGIQVKLNCSLTPYNVQDLEKLVEFSKKNKLVLQVADYMFPPIRRDKKCIGQNDRFTPKERASYHLKTYYLQHDIDDYYKYINNIIKGTILPPGLDENCIDPLDGKVRCRAGKASYWITWDGWMTPCGMMTGPKVDVSNQSFDAAWKQLVVSVRNMKLSGICAHCTNIQICHCCAAMALAETGTTEGIPRYLCETVKEMKKIAQNIYDLSNN